jgi:hypothetical protein
MRTEIDIDVFIQVEVYFMNNKINPQKNNTHKFVLLSKVDPNRCI